MIFDEAPDPSNCQILSNNVKLCQKIVKKSINLQPIQTLNQESNLKHKQKNYN